MTELKGIESSRAADMKADPRSEFFIFKNDELELKAGDDVLLLIGDPSRRREEYGMPLRLTDKTEPDENEVVIQYGDRLFVAQKIPEFI